MLDSLRARLAQLFRKDGSRVTEQSTLKDIALLYPTIYDFLLRRYALRIETRDEQMTLGDLVLRHGLPPAQIVFMEAQLDYRSERVPQLAAREAAKQMIRPEWKILDVREAWELQFGGLPKATPLDPSLWERILADWDRDTPILLYCHFGIRSLDAASQLLDRGFKNVHVLQGGIDAWAQDVDPTVSRYEGSWC